MSHSESFTVVESGTRAISRHPSIDRLINAHKFVKGQDLEKKQQKEKAEREYDIFLEA